MLVHAQTWDTSGNSMLNGKYYFRQVIYVPYQGSAGYITEAVAVYGNIEFDGNGHYSISTADNTVALDYSYYYGQVAYYGSITTTTGTYSISAAGYGYISSPYASNDLVYGLVSSQGIFVGSATENGNGYNDMLIAAPLASPVPTSSSFTGSWTCAGFDKSSGGTTNTPSYQFTLGPDGNGNLGVGTINGYFGGGGATLYSQTASGLKYTFSNGAAVATFPTNGTIISGQKYFYFSKDGNFMFGGGPATSNTPFDMIVGVKTSTGTPTFSGLYYQAGLDDAGGVMDSYFGSFDAIGGGAFVGHERVNTHGGIGLVDYTYDDSITLQGSSASNSYTRYTVGAGGAVEITSGVGGYLGLSVGLQAPSLTGPGVYLNPTAVFNSASFAPFTAAIAPGELLTLYGTNLAASTQVAGIPFPSQLNNVTVSIGGLPAPIFYVSSGQISAIVPYGVTAGTTCGCVQIQVTNNGTASNIITEYLGTTAPGVFTQNQNGTGYGEIQHLGIGNSVAAAGSIVGDKNPALPGETLAAYLTGLGTVSPTIADGAAGPSNSPSSATNTFSLDFDGTAAPAPLFAGLAPSFSGLYQLNFTVPSTGLTAGPNYLGIQGPDSYMSYLLIPIGTATSSASTAQARTADAPMNPRLRRPAVPVQAPRRPRK